MDAREYCRQTEFKQLILIFILIVKFTVVVVLGLVNSREKYQSAKIEISYNSLLRETEKIKIIHVSQTLLVKIQKNNTRSYNNLENTTLDKHCVNRSDTKKNPLQIHVSNRESIIFLEMETTLAKARQSSRIYRVRNL